MDPNANLEELRRHAEAVLTDKPNMLDYQWRAQRMAELVQALDGWISKGGFLPSDWRVGHEVGR
jgi:hypothetical protein